MTTRTMKCLLAAAAFATAAGARDAFSEVDYVWISTASPKSWDLTSTDWADANSDTLNVLWPSGDNSSTHAVFEPTIPFNSTTIPPGTVFVNGNITVNTIAVDGPGYTFALNSGNLTLVGSNPDIACEDSATFSVPLRGTNGATFAGNPGSGPPVIMTLTAVSTYTGGTTITAGTTSIGINNALPNADIGINGALALNTFNESFANVTLNANGSNANAALTSAGGILTAASLLNNGTITASASAPGALDGDMTVGDLNGSGNFTLNGTFLTAGVNAGAQDNYFGNLSGNGAFFKTGSSELILLGNTNLTGTRGAPDMTVEAGTLAGNTHSLAGTIFVELDASLIFSQAANGTFAGSLTGSGAVDMNAQSPGLVLTLTTPSTFTGTLDVSANIILAASTDTQLGTLITTIQNGSKNPPMTFTYATFIFDGGTLRTAASTAFARPFFINQNGGTLDTDAFTSIFSGAFTSTGNGTFTISGGGIATFSNTLSLNALAINQAGVQLSNSIVSNKTFTLASTSTALALTNASLTLTGYSATAAGAVSLLGNSDLILVNSNFQSASVSIGNAAGANGSASLTGVNANWTITGNLTLGQDAVIIRPFAMPPGVGSLSVPFFTNVSVTGTTTLLANSSLAVSGHFSTGALASSAGSAPTITISDFVISPPSPALVLGGDTAPNTTYSGTVTNATTPGSIDKIGANTQTFSGNNSYTGATNIDGGTLVIASNTALPAASLITNNATLTIAAPSVSANILSGTGTLTINANDHLTLAGSGASKQSGLTLNSLSLLDIGANPFILEATASNKSSLLNQTLLEVASAHSTNSGITSSTVTANPTHLALAVVDNAALLTPFTTFGGQPVDATSILITPALLGDSDLSGTVDLNDLNTVLNHLGQSTSAWTSGNFDNQPTIDLTDLNDVLNNLGTTFPTSSFSIPSAPEPASLSLLLTLLPPLLARRMRRTPFRSNGAANI